MLGEGNADAKLSEKKMEEEDSLKTLECLRGRLLAERVASRNAKDKAEIMGKKLIELEIKLREETKSRNKAEKKLKFLIKKLESENISYVKNSLDKECQESIGSTKSSYENVGYSCSELIERRKSEKNSSINLDKDDSQMSISSQENVNLSTKSSEFEFSKSDTNSLRNSVEEKGKNGKSEMDFQEDNVDNSMALVLMDLPKTKQAIDPIVLDATVREVLDGLRHAKEKIQTQMEGRQMIKAS